MSNLEKYRILKWKLSGFYNQWKMFVQLFADFLLYHKTMLS